MTNPFDYVNDVSFGKKNMMKDTDNDELAEKGYDPFLTNKALSQHSDSVMYANQMNLNHNLSKYAQYLYLLKAVPKRKRFGKWPKPKENADLEFVMERFGVSRDKATDYLKILSEKQLDTIRDSFYVGGR